MAKNSSLSGFLLGAAALVVILAGIKMAGEIVVPFLMALFIAIICSPIIKFMTARRLPHWLAVSVLFLFIVLIFFFLIGLINSSVREFTQSMPQYRLLLAQRLSDINGLAQSWNLPLSLQHEKVLEQLDPSAMMNFVSKMLLNFSNVVSNAFILILVVIFMLAEAPFAKRKVALALSKDKTQFVAQEQYIDRILQGVISYLGVKTLMSLLTALCIWALLEVFQVQYAVLWATLSFLFNYIPNIGSVIAAVPIVLQALLLNGFSVGFAVSIGVILINMLIGNILEPRLMGKKLGLSTLIVFLSLLFWGWLLGTVGMLLSVPLTMALKIALEVNPATVHYAALLGDGEEKDEIRKEADGNQ
ncbi:putative PurR-regulated permease PerM [Mesocricetibacter intestinalis]|uniref:Putative PurR-regulated permease PerM n=1 Tax=Mesocricetibacter intestinalis TaxID=1521930 RepID=A0A4R6V964_9PAST|nr:AI-2E family transporter [Mesocricetibacter intestinalis]TDQ58040.1 putative PurR-regulated permease PerM [Mesocricetibacter intestinalis]